MCKYEKIVAYSLSTLTYLTILQIFNLIGYEHKIFQLYLFDIAMTLKYDRGHWNWYEQVFNSMSSTIMRLTFISLMVSEEKNPNDKDFDKPWHLTDQKQFNYLP